MDLDDLLPRSASDWLALAAACLFMAIGVALIDRPDTFELRLLTLGWPAWPATLAGLLHVGGAVMLLVRRSRIVGAILLAALSAAELIAFILYRESESVFQAVCQLALVTGILVLEHRRRIAGQARV